MGPDSHEREETWRLRDPPQGEKRMGRLNTQEVEDISCLANTPPSTRGRTKAQGEAKRAQSREMRRHVGTALRKE